MSLFKTRWCIALKVMDTMEFFNIPLNVSNRIRDGSTIKRSDDHSSNHPSSNKRVSCRLVTLNCCIVFVVLLVTFAYLFFKFLHDISANDRALEILETAIECRSKHEDNSTLCS